MKKREVREDLGRELRIVEKVASVKGLLLSFDCSLAVACLREKNAFDVEEKNPFFIGECDLFAHLDEAQGLADRSVVEREGAIHGGPRRG